eukprot:1942206-Pyramimonas_sp.AAC.2
MNIFLDDKLGFPDGGRRHKAPWELSLVIDHVRDTDKGTEPGSKDDNLNIPHFLVRPASSQRQGLRRQEVAGDLLSDLA